MTDSHENTGNKTGYEILQQLDAIDVVLQNSDLTSDALEILQQKKAQLAHDFGRAALYAEALSKELGVEFDNPLAGILGSIGSAGTAESVMDEPGVDEANESDVQPGAVFYLDAENRLLFDDMGNVVREYSLTINSRFIRESMDIIHRIRDAIGINVPFTLSDVDKVREIEDGKTKTRLMANIIERFPSAISEERDTNGKRQYRLSGVEITAISDDTTDVTADFKERRDTAISLRATSLAEQRAKEYDLDKFPLDIYRRVEVTSGERTYISVIEATEGTDIQAILATRILQYLMHVSEDPEGKAPDTMTATLNTLMQEVIWTMTHDEIAQFEKPDLVTKHKKGSIKLSKKYLQTFRSSLVESIGLMQFEYFDGSVDDVVNISDGSITWKRSVINNLWLDFIPHTDTSETPQIIEPLYTYSSEPTERIQVTDREIDIVRSVLDPSSMSQRVSDRDAVLCLDVVVSPNFREVLASKGITVRPLERQKLFTIAKSSMRPESFSHALKSRTMKGNLAAFGKGVFQRTGRIDPSNVTPFFGQVFNR